MQAVSKSSSRRCWSDLFSWSSTGKWPSCRAAPGPLQPPCILRLCLAGCVGQEVASSPLPSTLAHCLLQPEYHLASTRPLQHGSPYSAACRHQEEPAETSPSNSCWRRLSDFALAVQLAAAEERQAATEAEVRDEVSAEMGELLRDMEAGYRVSSREGRE